jgi:hypothetical protein
MAKKKKISFKNKIASQVDRDKRQASSYGYLQLPKGVDILKVEGGQKINLDFIPYLVTSEIHQDRNDDDGVAIKGDYWWRRPFRIHRSIGANNDTIVCPASVGKKCPICEHRILRRNDGADVEELKTMNSSLRFLYAVIPIGNKKLDEKIHIWDFSYKNFQELLDDELEENEENRCFPDLEGGKTLQIRFIEASIGKTKFPKASRIDFEDRDEDYTEDILDDAPQLDDMLTILPYKTIEKMFFEFEADEDREEFDDDKDTPKEKKKKKKQKKQVDDEDIEEIDDTSMKRKKKKVTEEDKPKRTKKSKKECPEGYEFGVDTDDYEECEDCDLWDACKEAKKKNK